MDVHFIDTSILCNILNIPHMNADYDIVMEEYNSLNNEENVMILPLATIIEAGNHISHISNGDVRREKAIRMAEMLNDMSENKAPWTFFEEELTREELKMISEAFPDNAIRSVGIGDLSIISAFNKYKSNITCVRMVRIWSRDTHLETYCEIMPSLRRRKRK